MPNRPVVRGRSGAAARVRCAVVAAAVAAGCAHFNPQSFDDPNALFRATLHEFRQGRFLRAQAGFQRLAFELRASDSLAPTVRLYLAETYFGLRDYVTAAREFRRVADESPESPDAPTALLRAGDSFAQLWRRPELDPTNGQTAIATWQELQGRYPESEAATISGLRTRALQDAFARKEYETGIFYFRRGGYDSAILYFRNLISTYPSSALVPDAFVRLVRSYRAIGYREEQQETCAHLLQWYGERRDVREECGDRSTGR